MREQYGQVLCNTSNHDEVNVTKENFSTIVMDLLPHSGPLHPS
jgi:hypothetical protein